MANMAFLALLVTASVLASACTTVRVTATGRSSIEQRLLVRSLERAVTRLTMAPLSGKSARVQLFALTGDQAFAEEFLRARLEARGVRVVRAAEPADVVVRVFAGALAVDTAATLIGIPAISQVPVLAVPLPEIALFKWERSRGHAEVQLYTYDAEGRFLDRLPDALGEAKWNRFTILIVINFTVTDLDDPPQAQPPPAR
jgi:hypothetical protein